MSALSRRNVLATAGSFTLATVLGRPGDAAMGPDDKYDLVIKGGDVLDPSQSLRGKRDIGIRYGLIEALEADIPAARALRLLDATGKLVTPGLVDLHTHVFPYGSAIGIPADELVPYTCTTTCVSAGDAGANNFAAFRRYISAQTRTRLYAFVHISNVGLTPFPISELPTIEFADVDACAKTVAVNSDIAIGVKRQSKKRLLSGLLKCGCCGGGMTISRGDRYYCSARREKSTCNADRGIGATELEQHVLNGIRDILLGNEQLIDEFAAEFKRELARVRKEGNGAKRRLLKELQDVERGIKRCLDFITGGDGDPGSVRAELRRLETRKREINADLRSHQDGADVALHPNLPELYRKKVTKLQEALQHEATRPQVFETIRSLVDRIGVLPGRARGRCEVTIVGALAQILAFARQKTTAAPTRGGGTSLMVAGARNHRKFPICVAV